LFKLHIKLIDITRTRREAPDRFLSCRFAEAGPAFVMDQISGVGRSEGTAMTMKMADS
jgi:hypothetical protein